MRMCIFKYTLLYLYCIIQILFSTTTVYSAPAYRPGEVLIKFKSNQRAIALARSLNDKRVKSVRSLAKNQIHHVFLSPNLTVEEAVALYNQDPAVAYAEPNYLLSAQATPNDTYFNKQWGLHNSGQIINGYEGIAGVDLDALLAWETSTESTDVVIAVVDTGCDLNHPDLVANIWINPNEIADNGIDDDGNGYVDDVHGWDFSDGDNTPQDATGHGTHVAGIIAAEGNNARGVAGIAWHASIMPVRFMNAFDQGTTSDAIVAIEYAKDQGARIINCSWGGGGYSRALKEAMTSSNVLFVCAAGNSSTNIDSTPFYPAGFSLNNLISVAASDQMDQLTWFSNFGMQNVDLAAPGILIYSLGLGRQTLWQDNFNDGYIDDWIADNDPDTWKVIESPYDPGAKVLASSRDGDYADNINTWIIGPDLDLSDARACTLEFLIIGRSQSYSDYLYLEVSTDQSHWYFRPLKMNSTVKNGVSGSIQYWTQAKADLGPWDGESRVNIRFRFISDKEGNDTGFYIDNIVLKTAAIQDAYQFMSGTSMAVGFVSGVASLVSVQNTGLNAADIKAVIENSVDLDQNLHDLMVSGGRLNLYNALTLLNDLLLTVSRTAKDQISLLWNSQATLQDELIIERRTEEDDGFFYLTTVQAEDGAYTDKNLNPNTTYFYRVAAETLDGRNGYSNQTRATTLNNSAGSGSSRGGGGGGGCLIETLMR